jgi:NAD(P)-dependent dehydrogenase (short-subunit alcohol dehydrogenase family)
MVRFCSPMEYTQSPGDRLDVLVLNAGISKAALIADYTVEDFDNLFATNVRSPFFLVQQLIPTFGEDQTSS